MYCVKPYTSEDNKEETPKSCKDKNILEFRSTNIRQSFLIALLSNFVALIFVSDNIYLKFSATYFQYIPLQLKASDSANLIIQMAVVYTMGRALTVLISMRLKPQTIITYHMFVLIIALLIISVGENSYKILWTGSLLMSFGFSAILPAIFAFVGQYIEMTNRMGTIMIFNCGSLNSFVPFIMGSFIEIYPNIFLLIILINFIIAFVIFVTILYLTNVFDHIV